MQRAPWPSGFLRIPDEDWTRAPVETLAKKYDRVDAHSWYANLDPTVEDVVAATGDGDLIMDYSGGTGLFIQRFLDAVGERRTGVMNVDSSPKFLRLSLEKARDDPRVAFRLIRFLKEESRLQYVDEVLGPEMAARGFDAVVSTNAVHLYLDLDGTFRSWARVVRPGGRAFVQSGNIRNPEAGKAWIIDDTVEAIAHAAVDLARSDAAYAAYVSVLDDPARRAAFERHRRKVFPPVRGLDHYVAALASAGFDLERASSRVIEARTEDWLQFVSVYHDAVVGWVGGSEKVDGRTPSAEDVRARLDLMRRAAERVFAGAPTFSAAWTYLTGRLRS